MTKQVTAAWPVHYGRLALFVVATFVLGLLAGFVYPTGLGFALVLIVVLLGGFAVLVWPQRQPTRRELKQMWDEGEPVALFGAKMWPPHSSSCPVTATGHRGPCTCGADRGR